MYKQEEEGKKSQRRQIFTSTCSPFSSRKRSPTSSGSHDSWRGPSRTLPTWKPVLLSLLRSTRSFFYALAVSQKRGKLKIRSLSGPSFLSYSFFIYSRFYWYFNVFEIIMMKFLQNIDLHNFLYSMICMYHFRENK